jgi:ABC-type dipeptide/oligopeptide/nickel transport system permease subunit
MTTTATNSATPIAQLDSDRGNFSFRGRFIRTFFRNKIAVLGLVIVTIMIFCALTAPVISPYDPNKTNVRDRFKPPSETYFLGTDDYGRDIFSRLLYGASLSLKIALVSQTLAVTLGVTLGLISGWYGGLVDDFIMRLTDAIFAIPGLIFLIVWVTLITPILENTLTSLGLTGMLRDARMISIFIALGIIGWAGDARMMRGQVLSMKEREFIVAARAMGASPARIMFYHLLPNCLAPTIVLASLGIAGVILAESGLSYLGLGVQIPNPSWGSMINTGGPLLTVAWWYALFPGLAIMLTVLGFNFVGDGLRDALDPKLYE